MWGSHGNAPNELQTCDSIDACLLFFHVFCNIDYILLNQNGIDERQKCVTEIEMKLKRSCVVDSRFSLISFRSVVQSYNVKN